MKPKKLKTKTRTKAGRTASLRCDAVVSWLRRTHEKLRREQMQRKRARTIDAHTCDTMSDAIYFSREAANALEALEKLEPANDQDQVRHESAAPKAE